MALQKRVSELPAVTTVAGTDLLIVSSNNATKRTSVQQIGAYFAANGVAGPQGPQGPAGAPGATNFSQLTNVPATFQPSAHQHAISEVVGLSAALDGKQAVGSYATLVGGKVPESQLPPIVTTWEGLTGKPSTFPPSSHTHDDRYYTEAEVDTLLAGKQASGSYVLTTDARLSDARQPLTHQHALADVTGLQAALDSKQAAGSYATLTDGKVPASQLPSYVDDVIEAANLAALPGTGEAGKIYVTLDSNKTYRWSGSAYVEISASPGSTDAVAEGSTNLYFTNARASAAAPVQSVNGQTGTVTINVFSGSYNDLTNKPTLFSGSYADLTNVPSTFTPAAHNQAWSTITSTPTTLAGYGITDAVSSSDSRLTDARTPLFHTHSAAQISDFASAVAAASPEEVVEFLTPANFPATGNASLLYVATDNARAYRWVGSQYAEVGPTSLFMAGHTHAASEIVSGTIVAERLPLATELQLQELSSASALVTPQSLRAGLIGWDFVLPNQVSGASGGNATVNAMQMLADSTATAGGHVSVYTNSNGGLTNLMSPSSRSVDWTRRRWFVVRVRRESTNSSTGFGRFTYGWANFTAAAALPSIRSVGFDLRGTASRLWILAHDGTTLTQFDTGYDIPANTDNTNEYVIESTPSGTVNAYVDGVLRGTTTGGPTTMAIASGIGISYQVGNGGTAARQAYFVGRARFST